MGRKPINPEERKYIGADSYRKFTVTIPRDIDIYLDELRLAIKRNSGVALTRTDIVRAALEYLREIAPDPSEIAGEKDLLEKIREAARKNIK